MRALPLVMVLLAALSSPARAGGFASLRSPAQDLGLGEAGGAAAMGPDRALVNPGALSVSAGALWVEAGDQSGVRQQRVGFGLHRPWADVGLDLGLDSVDGLEYRDAQGAPLGSFGVQAPWILAAVARESGWGRWGVAAGGRDRRWLGGAYAPEGGVGWSWAGPLAVGLALGWRDLAWEGEASLAWTSADQRWHFEGGEILQGQESRCGLGAQWALWPGLGLRLGWTRWTNFDNQRWSLGLGWQGPTHAMSYAWLPGAAVGSGQKLSVRGQWGPAAAARQVPAAPQSTTAPAEVELDFVLPP